jgi:hypothetical protein
MHFVPCIHAMYYEAIHGMVFYTRNYMSTASYGALSDFSANGSMIYLSQILNVMPNLTRFTLATIFIGSFF